MKRNLKMYLDELNKALNEEAGFNCPFNEMERMIDETIEYNLNKEENVRKDKLLEFYKGIYKVYYERFQRTNLSVKYVGNYTEEQVLNKKARNVFFFNAVMNNIFKNIILKEFNEELMEKDINNKKINVKKDEYNFGAMREEELTSIDESLTDEKELQPYIKFQNKYNANSRSDGNKLCGVMKKILSDIQDAESLNEVQELVDQFSICFNLMRQEFNERSWFAKYLFISGIQEWYSLEHAYENLVDSIDRRFVDDIKFKTNDNNHTEKEVTLLDLDNKSIKDVLEYRGAELEDTGKYNEISMKVFDTIKELDLNNKDEVLNEEINVNKDNLVEGTTEKWITDEEIEMKLEDVDDKIDSNLLNKVVDANNENENILHMDDNDEFLKNIKLIDDEIINENAKKAVDAQLTAEQIKRDHNQKVKEIKISKKDYKKLSEEEKNEYNSKIAENDIRTKVKLEEVQRVPIELDLDFVDVDNEISNLNGKAINKIKDDELEAFDIDDEELNIGLSEIVPNK